MPSLGLRFSTRRLMVAAALAAVVLAGIIQARKWTRVRAAQRSYAANLAYHEEGRVTVDRHVESSRRLMDAEALASWTWRGRLAAIDAHLARSARFVEAERRQQAAQPPPSGRGASADLPMAEQSIEEVKEQRSRLIEGSY